MTSYQVYNQNVNYKRKNPSKTPINSFNRYKYGEKIREKDNYSLYISGSGHEKTEYNKPQKEKQGKPSLLNKTNKLIVQSRLNQSVDLIPLFPIIGKHKIPVCVSGSRRRVLVRKTFCGSLDTIALFQKRLPHVMRHGQ